jgi:hypothetical protein
MDGYLIEERLLDGIMIEISDQGGGNLEIAFSDRDRRYLSQFTPAQQAQWLQDALLHCESGCALETPDGKPAWIVEGMPRRPPSPVKAMRPARGAGELPPGLEFLRRG